MTQLETERLLLRAPEPDDAEALLEGFADPEVMRYLGSGETGTLDDAVAAIDGMRGAWEADGFGRFAVVPKAEGAVVGRVGLLAWDPQVWRPGTRAEIGEDAEIELGWTLVRRAWGHGYATEAAKAVAEWAFSEVRPARLISLIHPENDRSKRVAARIGEHAAGRVVTHRGVEVELWSF